MYSKYNRLLQSTSISLPNKTNSLRHKIDKISIRFNTVNTSITQATFKYSANINNKDCIRLAFIYGMCGTFASYLSMNYDGKVLVFKWSVPTPERFVFCTWCWAVGGMASWMLFWTKPHSLMRAASSRIRHGFLHGTQTTTLALGLSFATIGCWSTYFDVKEWQNRVGEWRKSLSNINNNGTSVLMTDIPNTLIEEEGNEEGDSKVNIVNMDEMDSGVKIINNKLESDENKNINNKVGEIDINKLNELRENKPILTYQIVGSNMYEPMKLFFMCNAPIWLICGSFTGMIAARVLLSNVNANIATASAAMFCIDNYNQNNLYLLDDNHYKND